MKKSAQALRQLLMVTCISASTITIAQEVDSVTHRPNSERLASNQLHSLAPLNCNGEPAAPSRMMLPLGKSTLLPCLNQ